MDFRQVKSAVQRQFNLMKAESLFRVQADKDKLWATYLESFPEGTNPTYRKRTEHDCSCCRGFVKRIGDLVAIKDGKLVSIWDCDAGDYQPVVDALAAYVKSLPIENVFLHPETDVGTDKTFEQADADVLTWQHFHVKLPPNLIKEKAEIGPQLAEYTASHDVLLRSLREISPESLATVQELIAQNSLYRGAEKKALVDTFARMKREWPELPSLSGRGPAERRERYVWSHVRGPTAFVSKIRNDVIGWSI